MRPLNVMIQKKRHLLNETQNIIFQVYDNKKQKPNQSFCVCGFFINFYSQKILSKNHFNTNKADSQVCSQQNKTIKKLFIQRQKKEKEKFENNNDLRCEVE